MHLATRSSSQPYRNRSKAKVLSTGPNEQNALRKTYDLFKIS